MRRRLMETSCWLSRFCLFVPFRRCIIPSFHLGIVAAASYIAPIFSQQSAKAIGACNGGSFVSASWMTFSASSGCLVIDHEDDQRRSIDQDHSEKGRLHREVLSRPRSDARWPGEFEPARFAPGNHRVWLRLPSGRSALHAGSLDFQRQTELLDVHSPASCDSTGMLLSSSSASLPWPFLKRSCTTRRTTAARRCPRLMA